MLSRGAQDGLGSAPLAGRPTALRGGLDANSELAARTANSTAGDGRSEARSPVPGLGDAAVRALVGTLVTVRYRTVSESVCVSRTA